MTAKLFETPKHLERESRAIKLWTRNLPEGSYEKLGGFDIDFRVYSHKTGTYAYVEVKGRHRYIDKAFPLPIAARKLVKIHDLLKNDPKTDKAFIIWACEDGIIAGDIEDLIGRVNIGGRYDNRKDAANDIEVMVEYDTQSSFKKTMY
jgi:hypothetical protein